MMGLPIGGEVGCRMVRGCRAILPERRVWVNQRTWKRRWAAWVALHPHSLWNRVTPASRSVRGPAFSLVELLVVIAVIGILAALLLPALARAREKAKVVKVHTELHNVGLALHMYADDHEGRVPPVRVNCNSDTRDHWCPLPIELAQAGFLARSRAVGREANLEDPFHLGHTYKYAAPGPQLLNDEPVGDYPLWVPGGFPDLRGYDGEHYRDPGQSPVRWVVWSLGPRPRSNRSQSQYAPMSSDTWYRRAGDDGVIVRFADRHGAQYKSP